MKYSSFKRYKFVTIFKNFNFKRLKLYTTIKNIKFKAPNFSKIYYYIDFRRYNFYKIYTKYFNLRRYKSNLIYFITFTLLIFFIYLSAPIFFKYDKLSLSDVVCKELKIECLIKGKVNYSFFPSPRIKIKNFVIKDLFNANKNLAHIDNVSLRLSIFNLTNKRKFSFTKIKFENAQIEINLKNFDKYKNFLAKGINSKPIYLEKAVMNFFEDNKYLTSLENMNLKYKPGKKSDRMILKGKILDNNINVNFVNKKNSNNLSKIYIIKLLDLNLFTKIELINSKINKDIISGKALLKMDKSRLTTIFDFIDNKIIFKQANLRNPFVDGKFNGELNFVPYFNFNLDLDLNSINFNKLYSSLISLDEQEQKDLFKINKKINGKLNIFGNKIFSKYTLINSFESRLQFINGNILVQQLLLNLGKLGAADITGIIQNEKKFSNFKFEKNIFVDNLKRFYNKFGIYNKKKTSSNMFISGNLDLVNLNLFLNEISQDKKIHEDELTYIEKEFNDILLAEGYKSFFDFLKLKEFVKIITSEDTN